MSNRLLVVAACMFEVLIAWSGPKSLIAKDYFLTIGGGYDVTGNQLSLERNVIFQQSVLEAHRPDRPSYDVWFADGDDPHPDLQCRNPKYEEEYSLARRMLAELLGDADAADLTYRNNEVPHLRGPSELERVRQRFAQVADQAKAGDRVIVYVAAHGGKARGLSRRRRESGAKSNPYNTTILFWNNEQVTASEFTGWLDRFPADTQIILVMVQCYAGGFAHTIFEKADANIGLSDHARCGFFAQLHDRSAAGCTPDADEADYEEYSTYFWGALGGKTRDGKSIADADYNKDGKISFAEAHSYAVIESDTIDVPVCTTEALLRKYSELPKSKENEAEAKNRSADKNSADDELVKLSGPLSTLAEDCRPEQRAVLDQLPAKLGLRRGATVEDVEKKLTELDGKLDAADAKAQTATRTRRSALKAVRNEIYGLWPELQTEWAPLAVDLATDRADEFVDKVQKLPDYATYRYAKKREDELVKASMQVEREKARAERLLRACETAVLAANLAKVAKPEIVKHYEQLVAMENATLDDSSGVGGGSRGTGN